PDITATTRLPPPHVPFVRNVRVQAPLDPDRPAGGARARGNEHPTRPPGRAAAPAPDHDPVLGRHTGDKRAPIPCADAVRARLVRRRTHAPSLAGGCSSRRDVSVSPAGSPPVVHPS